MKAGWEVKRLGDVTTKIGSGATPRGGENSYKQEGLSLIRSLNVHDLQFRTKDLARIDKAQADALANVIVERNDVLLNITGASVARCAIVPADVLPARVNQHVSIIRPKPDEVDSRFLAYLLVSSEIKQRLLGIGDEGGSTRQALTKAQLQAFEIPVPPLDEQRRIVAVLDEALEGLARARAHAEANLQNARELFEVRRADIFSSKAEGKPVLLGDVCARFEYGTAAKSKPEGLLPVLRMGNLQDGEIDWADLVYSDDPNDCSRYLLRRGDVLFNRTNSPAHVGKTSIFDGDRPAIFAGYLIRVTPDPTRLIPEFLNHFLNSDIARQYGRSVMGTSVNQANISAGRLKGYAIRLPSLARQAELAASLDELKDAVKPLQELYRSKKRALDDLRQSLLQKAFAGELT